MANKKWLPFLVVFLAALGLLSCEQRNTGDSAIRISRIVDGDTIDVSIAGNTQRVRLIGMDTPEVYGRVDCFGQEASDFTKSLLPTGTVVRLEKDVSETDRYERLLRYVYLPDGRMLNEVLVAEGYATVATFPPDVKYQDRFLAAQQTAREQNKGLWGRCQQPSALPTRRERPDSYAAYLAVYPI